MFACLCLRVCVYGFCVCLCLRPFVFAGPANTRCFLGHAVFAAANTVFACVCGRPLCVCKLCLPNVTRVCHFFEICVYRCVYGSVSPTLCLCVYADLRSGPVRLALRWIHRWLIAHRPEQQEKLRKIYRKKVMLFFRHFSGPYALFLILFRPLRILFRPLRILFRPLCSFFDTFPALRCNGVFLYFLAGFLMVWLSHV